MRASPSLPPLKLHKYTSQGMLQRPLTGWDHTQTLYIAWQRWQPKVRSWLRDSWWASTLYPWTVLMTDRKPSAPLASGRPPLKTVFHGLGIPTGIPSTTAFHREGEPFLSGRTTMWLVHLSWRGSWRLARWVYELPGAHDGERVTIVTVLSQLRQSGEAPCGNGGWCTQASRTLLGLFCKW